MTRFCENITMWNHIVSAMRCMNRVHSKNYAAFVICCVSLCLNAGNFTNITFRSTSLAPSKYHDCPHDNLPVKQPWTLTLNISIEPWSNSHIENIINLCSYCAEQNRMDHAFFTPLCQAIHFGMPPFHVEAIHHGSSTHNSSPSCIHCAIYHNPNWICANLWRACSLCIHNHS